MANSQVQYEECLSLIDVGVGIFDADLRLLHCNPAFRKMRRYPDDFCHPGISLTELLSFNAQRGDFGPGDPDAHVTARLGEIETAREREVEFQMADGQILLIKYRRMADNGLLITYQDLTAQRQSEQAVRASEERHQLVTRATSDGIYDWNVADDELYVSDHLAKLLNLDLTRQTSKMWAEQIHPDDYQDYVDGIVAHFKGDSDAVECDYRLRAKDGGYRWVHDRGVGLRDAKGRVIRLVGAVRDVTDLRTAKAEIEHVEGRLLGALETISDGILLVSPDGRVELFNDRYVQIFSDAVDGADLSDVIVKGRDFFDMIRNGYELGMFKSHPEGVDGWIAARREAWKRPVANWELELANGTWILLNEREMADGGRISVYTDITELKRRESEALAARERFEEAIEALSTGFALWDAEDRMVVCNSRYREYFAELADIVNPGTEFGAIMKAGIERGLFPLAKGDTGAYLAAIAEKRARGVGETREQLISDHWLQVTDHRTKDGIVSIYSDVTELKTKQMEIEKQSAILRLTMENMGQGITLVDENLETIALNRKFLELLELPEDRFGGGFTMEEAFRYNAERGEYGPGNIEEQVQERLKLAAKFEAHKFERVRPDGIVIEVVGHPIDGGGFVSTYTDITDRKRAEEERNAALSEFNAVLENIDYGVIFMGPDLRARIINKVMRNFWKFTPEFVDSKPSMRELIEFNREEGIYDLGGEKWDDWIEARVERVRQGGFEPIELHRTDGLILRHQCVALPDGGRMLTYFDITEQRNREKETERARDAAEAALEDLRTTQERLVQSEKMASLGQLTAGIAHEIKNPLNFVNNFAKLSEELLEELSELIQKPLASLGEEERDDAQDLLETVSSNLGKINHHGKRADSIVRNMLLHSREGPVELQRVGLNPIVEEALNLAYHGARAENPGFNIEMETEFDDAVGEIDCYSQDLMRVFLNLIGNGMYAADKRRETENGAFAPKISVTTRAGNDAVEVEVRDNGTGIPPEVRERIFLPFFTTKPAGDGTGLGLSLSYDIVVKRHGGTLDVDSMPGEFTSFVVSIPTKAPDAKKP